MRLFLIFTIAIIFAGCATNNYEVEVDGVELEDNDKVAVCGEVAGDKQTYPTMGDLKSDGAEFLFYGPCYE